MHPICGVSLILVVGATGFLGERVVRQLTDLGLPVRALVRAGSAYYRLNDTGCAYRFGDLRDEGSLDRATEGVEAIISAAGIDLESRGADHASVTVAGHQALFRAAWRQGVRKIVHISAVGAERLDAPWFSARGLAEQALVRSELDWTILRLPPLAHTWARLSLHPGRALPGAGANRVATLSSTDAARLAVVALGERTWRGKAVSLFGPRTLSGRELLDRARQLTGGPRGRHLPAAASRLLALASLPAGRRWGRALAHQRALLTHDFSPPGPPPASVAGLSLTPVQQALEEDAATLLQRLRDREDPSQHASRRFCASAYQPGEVPLDEIPPGPRSYR